jgi:hypothetical protein
MPDEPPPPPPPPDIPDYPPDDQIAIEVTEAEALLIGAFRAMPPHQRAAFLDALRFIDHLFGPRRA